MWQPIWELLYKGGVSYLAGIQPYRGICFCIGCQTFSRLHNCAGRDTSGCRFVYCSVERCSFATIGSCIGERKEQALFVHTAGSMSMDLWKGLVKRYGVLYPMQTFSKQREVDFNTVPFL